MSDILREDQLNVEVTRLAIEKFGYGLDLLDDIDTVLTNCHDLLNGYGEEIGVYLSTDTRSELGDLMRDLNLAGLDLSEVSLRESLLETELVKMVLTKEKCDLTGFKDLKGKRDALIDSCLKLKSRSGKMVTTLTDFIKTRH
ncbi:MAG: hypothetical protein GOV15_00355 [Candidatus Diapherotrites archaeon]|nr:hypothetical protein [Candidatus Diapherotrites archaeon]